MSNTLTAYPTDLATPCQILLTRFSATPAPVNEQYHAVYQILGVAAGNLYPDGPSPTPTKDIWDRPDGMKATPRLTEDECKKCLEDACKMQGKIGDWLKTPAGQMLIQLALSMLPAILAAL